MSSFRYQALAICIPLFLIACGGDATVGRDGNATGGDGVGGNIDPTIDIDAAVTGTGSTTKTTEEKVD